MTIPIREIAWYGWKPDLPDFRDFKFTPTLTAAALPTKVDNRSTDWGVYDQGAIGSCTANATLSAYRNLLKREGLPDFDGSRMAQYYWSRYIEHTTQIDAGAELRDAVKVLKRWGVASEKSWPYYISKIFRGPPKKVGDEAKKHIALQYQSVNLDRHSIRAAVVQNGHVIIGIAVYESFESYDVFKTGYVPMPSYNEQLLGGHAVEVIGYDMSTDTAICKNSWGTDWGDGGYFYIPFDYITDYNLAGDFWTLVVVK